MCSTASPDGAELPLTASFPTYQDPVLARCTFGTNLVSFCAEAKLLVHDLTEIPLPQALHLEELPGPFNDLE